MHKRIKCNGDEFDGYEIIVESVQPAPGSMWTPNIRVGKDGIEPPRRYDFDIDYQKSGEARRAGVEVERVFVRGIGRYHRLSGICNVMPKKPGPASYRVSLSLRRQRSYHFARSASLPA
ncbi:hypothetical protein [Burkholderia sp. BCC0044]|uniref:hypothetical protein n=1 Tax=Burkholderia sp. BCC0044 TaxID=2676295 RepID=UPI001FC8A127|nr:hypothetical protein [Burkholderia sp. BCC0044]